MLSQPRRVLCCVGNIKSFIENNFSIVLLISIAIGIFFKELQYLPDYTVIVLIALMIFFSCSNVSLSDVKTISKKQIIVFYLARYVLLPVVFYYLSMMVVPDYAVGILLISIIPAGITSTALVNIMGGNTSFSFVVTILTGALAPFTIPFIMDFVIGKNAPIETLNMFTTLFFTIFVPSVFYFLFIRKTKKIKHWVISQSKAIPILLMSFVIAILIASQRHYFFENIETVIFTIFLGCILYALLYAAGWCYAIPLQAQEKKTYAICSGANNLGLAAALALLYFSPLIILFTALCEISWVLSLAVFKKYADYKTNIN